MSTLKKWLDALRSGEYKQSKRSLRDSELGCAYCCLGVLCEVDRCDWDEVYEENEGDEILPESLRDKYKFNSCVGLIEKEDNSYKYPDLASMNDSGKSFMEIADFIENNLDAIFSDGGKAISNDN